MHLHKGANYTMKIALDRLFLVGPSRLLSRLESHIQFVALVRAGRSHVRMLEHSGEIEAVFGSSPIENCLGNQQMKQGIVRGRYRAPQAGLLRALGLAFDKVLSLFEQALGQSHALFPVGVLHLGLVRIRCES
jgi:hypothetical protein